MPELPEVETIVQELNSSGIIGRTIVDVSIGWGRTIATPPPDQFREKISGQKIKEVKRRGKFILIVLSNDTLMIHLRMSGRLRITDSTAPHVKEERAALILDNLKQIRFEDTRKFGRWYLVHSPDSFLDHKLGPEPLQTQLTPILFYQRLVNHSRQIKALLLDQKFIAGLGNIYVDEALWEAKIHPLRLSNLLSKKDAAILLSAIRVVLKRGLESQGTTLGNGKSNFYRLDGSKGKNKTSLNVFRRTGLPCPRCKHTISRMVVGQRGTHYCRQCQKP